MTPQEIYSALINVLDSSTTTTAYWTDTEDSDWDSDRWTAMMTSALVTAVRQVAVGTEDFIVAAKNHPDIYGRSEYLNIDVMGFVDDWSSPTVAIEHENNVLATKLRYCLWKLLVVGAPASILVCYIDPTGSFGRCFRSVEALRTALQEVHDQHPDRAVYLIIGEWNKERQETWSEVFTLHQV